MLDGLPADPPGPFGCGSPHELVEEVTGIVGDAQVGHGPAAVHVLRSRVGVRPLGDHRRIGRSFQPVDSTDEIGVLAGHVPVDGGEDSTQRIIQSVLGMLQPEARALTFSPEQEGEGPARRLQISGADGPPYSRRQLRMPRHPAGVVVGARSVVVQVGHQDDPLIGSHRPRDLHHQLPQRSLEEPGLGGYVEGDGTGPGHLAEPFRRGPGQLQAPPRPPPHGLRIPERKSFVPDDPRIGGVVILIRKPVGDHSHGPTFFHGPLEKRREPPPTQNDLSLDVHTRVVARVLTDSHIHQGSSHTSLRRRP